VRDVKWSDSGELVALVGEASFYVLRFDRGAVEAALEVGEVDEEDGIDEAFAMETETSESVRTGAAVGHACFGSSLDE
jgi:coatomer subunit beta'